LRRELPHFPHENCVVERLVHDYCISMVRGKVVPPVGGDKQKWDASARQYICDIIDALATKVDVEDGAIDGQVTGHLPGFIQGPGHSNDFEALIVEQAFDICRYEELIFNDQKSRHFLCSVQGNAHDRHVRGQSIYEGIA
jgi:hypothetical protein